MEIGPKTQNWTRNSNGTKTRDQTLSPLNPDPDCQTLIWSFLIKIREYTFNRKLKMILSNHDNLHVGEIMWYQITTFIVITGFDPPRYFLNHPSDLWIKSNVKFIDPITDWFWKFKSPWEMRIWFFWRDLWCPRLVPTAKLSTSNSQINVAVGQILILQSRLPLTSFKLYSNRKCEKTPKDKPWDIFKGTLRQNIQW